MKQKDTASGSRIAIFTRLRRIITRTPAAWQPKKQKSKKLALVTFRKYININLEIMALTDREPITKLEKWLNRIVLLGLLVWETIQKVIDIIKDGV